MIGSRISDGRRFFFPCHEHCFFATLSAFCLLFAHAFVPTFRMFCLCFGSVLPPFRLQFACLIAARWAPRKPLHLEAGAGAARPSSCATRMEGARTVAGGHHFTRNFW